MCTVTNDSRAYETIRRDVEYRISSGRVPRCSRFFLSFQCLFAKLSSYILRSEPWRVDEDQRHLSQDRALTGSHSSLVPPRPRMALCRPFTICNVQSNWRPVRKAFAAKYTPHAHLLCGTSEKSIPPTSRQNLNATSGHMMVRVAMKVTAKEARKARLAIGNDR